MCTVVLTVACTSLPQSPVETDVRENRRGLGLPGASRHHHGPPFLPHGSSHLLLHFHAHGALQVERRESGLQVHDVDVDVRRSHPVCDWIRASGGTASCWLRDSGDQNDPKRRHSKGVSERSLAAETEAYHLPLGCQVLDFQNAGRKDGWPDVHAGEWDAVRQRRTLRPHREHRRHSSQQTHHFLQQHLRERVTIRGDAGCCCCDRRRFHLLVSRSSRRGSPFLPVLMQVPVCVRV